MRILGRVYFGNSLNTERCYLPVYATCTCECLFVKLHNIQKAMAKIEENTIKFSKKLFSSAKIAEKNGLFE